MLQLSHKSLMVYQQGLNLVAEVYKKTKLYPKEEQFILVSQLRRAVISVCSNLAEDAARRSHAEKKRFMRFHAVRSLKLIPKSEYS